MAKSASAASSTRRAITGQGLRLSERLMQQKSWPSGAPARAAAASMAVMPGSTWISSACQAAACTASADSMASNTADAMANTPGSPEDTTTTCRPCAASASAWRARSSSTRLSEACQATAWP